MDARRRATPSYSALVVDQDPGSAIQFQEILERMGVQADVVASVATAASLAASNPPNILVIEAHARDDADGLTLASTLVRRHGTACILVLEGLETAMLQRALTVGARAVLCRPLHGDQIQATLEWALQRRRERPRHDEARARLLEVALRRLALEAGHIDGVDAIHALAPALWTLSPREQQVVSMLLQHLRVPAIARQLGITQQTVRNHLKSVFRQVGVRNQQELLDHIALGALGRDERQGGGNAK